MKAAIVYSGKGGVGKTTTTANIARILAREGKKVFVLDMDINTPSMNTEFKGEKPEPNLYVHSTGNMYDKFIFLQDSMVTRFIREAMDKIRSFKPDVVLIDTPPSMTQTHIALLQNITVSLIVFVSQPTALSREDVMRTMTFFKDKGTAKAVMVENMCSKNQGEYNYGIEVVARIPLLEGFNTTNLANDFKDEYLKIAECVLHSDTVEQKQLSPGTRYDETFDIVRIENHYSRGRVQGYDIFIKRDGEEQTKEIYQRSIHMLSVRTWKKMRNYILYNTESMRYDQRVSNCDYDRIKRTVEPFYQSELVYFMVTNPPACVIHLIAGEIGQATLDTEGKYHNGIPMLRYQTSKGEITLFPDEVRPVTDAEVQEFVQQEGYVMLTDGRYLPPKNVVEECSNAFGERIGLGKGWEKIYDDWTK